MEQIKDFRLTATPPVLLIVCLVLLLGRVGLSVFEWVHPAERGRPLAWSDIASTDPSLVAEATDKKKLKLYEFYAEWCSPCQRMERDVMTNDEIRGVIEKNFVPLRVTDRLREDGKNSKLVSELQKKYRIFAFPTMVAVAPDGEAIGLLVGNSSSLAVYRFLSRSMNDPKAPGHSH